MIGNAKTNRPLIGAVLMLAILLIAPHLFYPVFLMKVLCFALFACAFNLLLGYVGLLSFGHAAFFGSAGYVTAHAVKVLNLSPILGILLGGPTETNLRRAISLSDGDVSILFGSGLAVSLWVVIVVVSLLPVVTSRILRRYGRRPVPADRP